MNNVCKFFVRQDGSGKRMNVGVVYPNGEYRILVSVPTASGDYEEICKLGRFLESYYYPKAKPYFECLRKMGKDN